MKFIKITFVVITILTLISCEKILFEQDLESVNPQENLDYLWKECNEKYSYFDLKNIDWNAVKADYDKKIYEGMTQDSLFNVLGSMLSLLKDDHTNLISNFNVSRYGVLYGSQDNFDWRIITDNYIGQNYYVTGPFNHAFLDNNEIGYVRFGAFTGTVNSTNLDFILNRYKDTKGLIFDLRENGGGSVDDVFKLLERFIANQTTVYHSRIKTGSGHNDFSEPEAAVVQPYPGIKYTKDIVVLTDRSTYSAGSFTSLATKAIPNMTLLGDTTGGGLGLPNGGQLPNGWTYRFSITQTLDLNLDPSFENGVPPDIYAQIDWNDLTKDEILDQAILELQ